MSLPFVWPAAIAGEGRLTEIASFRKSNIPDSRFQHIYSEIMGKVAEFPISRQNLYGIQHEDPDIFVLVADWTSAEEKDRFEPGEQYQSIKPAFGELVNPENPDFECHHIILPTAAPTTPDAGFYVVARMRIPPESHGAVASAYRKYTDTLMSDDGHLFLTVAPSREDKEVVVCFAGFRGQVDASRADENPAHVVLKNELDKYTKEGVKYGAVLRRAA